MVWKDCVHNRHFFFKKSTYYVLKLEIWPPSTIASSTYFYPPLHLSLSSLTTIVLDISIVYFVWKIRVKMMQEPISSIITKVEMVKDIHLQIWKRFAIWRSKFNRNCLLTCNLWTSQLQVSKLVAIEFACSSGNFFFKFANGKTFTQLQMDIFCQFDFCHNRKNAFRKDTG